jgi:hypothetical protein
MFKPVPSEGWCSLIHCFNREVLRESKKREGVMMAMMMMMMMIIYNSFLMGNIFKKSEHIQSKFHEHMICLATSVEDYNLTESHLVALEMKHD